MLNGCWCVSQTIGHLILFVHADMFCKDSCFNVPVSGTFNLPVTTYKITYREPIFTFLAHLSCPLCTAANDKNSFMLHHLVFDNSYGISLFPIRTLTLDSNILVTSSRLVYSQVELFYVEFLLVTCHQYWCNVPHEEHNGPRNVTDKWDNSYLTLC